MRAHPQKSIRLCAAAIFPIKIDRDVWFDAVRHAGIKSSCFRRRQCALSRKIDLKRENRRHRANVKQNLRTVTAAREYDWWLFFGSLIRLETQPVTTESQCGEFENCDETSIITCLFYHARTSATQVSALCLHGSESSTDLVDWYARLTGICKLFDLKG